MKEKINCCSSTFLHKHAAEASVYEGVCTLWVCPEDFKKIDCPYRREDAERDVICVFLSAGTCSCQDAIEDCRIIERLYEL